MTAPDRWLCSARFDLAFFIGPAALSLLLVIPAWFGWIPDLDTPLWAWIALVLAVDVAHVWSSLYRVYLDPAELRRRPWLYALCPLGVYLASTLLYAVNPAWFWTTLAYIAVHHFVKQQVGFVSLYRHRGGERDPRLRRLDQLAVYTGTLVPIAYWHVHLPREIHWFLPGDFLGPWPSWLMDALWPLYVLVGGLWAAQRLHQGLTTGRWNPGKDLTMLATWSMWFVGIVAIESDYVFTATNVLLHGVPYIALVWLTTHRRAASQAPARSGRILRWALRRAWIFVGLILALAFAEEALWDTLLWHDHPQLFGDWDVPDASWVPLLFVPLLTVPQATHYVLDGFIWRMDGSNPGLREALLDVR